MFKYALAAAAILAASSALAMPIVTGDGNETCNGGACVVVHKS